MDTTCRICAKSFKTTAIRLATGHGKFCSKPCFYESKRTAVEKSCPQCSKSFVAKPARIAGGRGKFCSKTCYYRSRIGTVGHWLGKKRNTPWMLGKSNHRFGKKPWNWNDDLTTTNSRIRHSDEYKEWRTHVFQRDDYTCQGCGQRGGHLEADHEMPFSLFPQLRFEILNGRTFCKECHIKYGWRNFRYNHPRKHQQFDGTNWSTIMNVAQ